MISFCPVCWSEVGEAGKCPKCGSDLRALDQSDYEQKLIRALRHPEPTTPIRVAEILGELRSAAAVEPLIELASGGSDPYIQEAAVIALGRIGDLRAVGCLQALSREGAVRVRLAAQSALKAMRSSALEKTHPGSNDG